jgi:hypothetical protein
MQLQPQADNVCDLHTLSVCTHLSCSLMSCKIYVWSTFPMASCSCRMCGRSCLHQPYTGSEHSHKPRSQPPGSCCSNRCHWCSFLSLPARNATYPGRRNTGSTSGYCPCTAAQPRGGCTARSHFCIITRSHKVWRCAHAWAGSMVSEHLTPEKSKEGV